MTRACFFACLVAFAAGCRGDDGTVTISGDVAGLDTIALRADSLIANAGRLSGREDSLRAIIEGRVPGVTPISDSIVTASAGTLTGSTPARVTEGAALTRRAHARGDSMARAAAARYAAGGTASSRARADSIKGTIRLIGDAPAVQPVLQTDRSSAPVMMSGMATNGMQRLEGAEIVVYGLKTSPRDIVVADFAVISVHGTPAFDGILNSDTDGFSITLSDGSGRKRLTAVPEALRELAGARVWVSVADGGSVPRSYGYIGRR